MFNFSVFVWKYPRLRKLFQKIKIACWSWNLKPRIILCKVWWWFSFLSYLARKYPFWVNLVQKFKIVSLSWKLVTRLFRNVKFDGDLHLFYFRPFFQVLLKKFIWHFGVTRLISRQFTRRGVKPMAFLVSIKRWKISSQQPLFRFPWLSDLVCNSNDFVQTITVVRV